jgi:hypothetical protein
VVSAFADVGILDVKMAAVRDGLDLLDIESLDSSLRVVAKNPRWRI